MAGYGVNFAFLLARELQSKDSEQCPSPHFIVCILFYTTEFGIGT